MYFSSVDSTLTIRLPKEQRDALRRKATAFNKTESDFVRALIAQDLANSSLLERVRDLVGSLDSGIVSRAQAHPLKKALRERNWRS